jgi:hypothetical protein
VDVESCVRGTPILWPQFNQVEKLSLDVSVADPDPDVWDLIQIRIPTLLNDSISTFLVCVRAINTFEISVASLFGS